MTRYFRPADAVNPALDLAVHDAFELDIKDGNGRCSYPRGWLKRAQPEDLARCGFAAYQPAPLPPPPVTPKTMALSRVQVRLILFLPASVGGLGFAENDVRALIRGLPAGQREAAEIRFDHAEYFNWEHPFVQALVPYIMSAKGLTLEQVRAAWVRAGVL
jgi:hypothetical protein